MFPQLKRVKVFCNEIMVPKQKCIYSLDKIPIETTNFNSSVARGVGVTFSK